MQEEIHIDHLKIRKSFREKWSDFFANPKKRLWFIIISGLVLIAAVGTGLYLMTRSSNNSPAKSDDSVINTTDFTTKYYSTLDGTETDQGSANAHPLAIMVENHIDARPQSGLDKASVVYEAIAEGGITRFMAVFGPRSADKVGPVRSARTYYVDWALGYNAYLAHVGGNYDALEQIISDKVLDLDQFKYSSSYWREKRARVSSEHTMYASTIKLREQAAKLNYSTDNNFRTYKFKELATNDSSASASSNTSSIKESQASDASSSTSAATPAAGDIHVNFSSTNYNVIFRYDSVTDSYKRIISGSVQKDNESKAEISPTNLIVMTVKRAPTVTKINEQGWIMDTVGQGSAKIFLDGKVIDGKWKKDSKTQREVFYDSNDQEITFNRGQFWICVIPPDSTVTY